jgi:hypothetical protein
LRTVASATLFLVSAWPCLSQDSGHSESAHLAFDCHDVAEVAPAYLKQHGVLALPSWSFEGFLIRGAPPPWTDAQGNQISDFKVYWTYSNRNDGEKLPFGIWHLRLQRYTPTGELRLSPDERGCTVDFRLEFFTAGANVIAILPVDSTWSYGSNGRLEREYVDGISKELSRRKAEVPTP